MKNLRLERKIFFWLVCFTMMAFLPAEAQKSTKVTITKETIDENGNKSTQTIVKEGAEAEAIDIESLAEGKPHMQQFGLGELDMQGMEPFSFEGGMMDLRSLFDSLGMGNFDFFGGEDFGFSGGNPFGVEDDRPRLGVQIQALETQSGVLVTKVLEGTPAERAGLREGDIILSVDGSQVLEPQDLVDLVQASVGMMEIDVVRDEKHLSLTADMKNSDPKKELEIRKL